MEKIVICSPQLGLSPDSNLGGEVHDREVLKALADLGVEVHIILPLFKKYETHKNFHVYYLPVPFVYPPWLFNFLLLPYLLIIKFITNFSILRVHSPRFVGPAALIFKRLFPRVKIVSTFHHLEEESRVETWVAKESDLIVTVSEGTKTDLLARSKNKLASEKVVVIGNGIDPKYVPKKKNTLLLERHHLLNKKVLLYLGHLIKRKNLPFLLTVLKDLPPDYVLLICGDGPEKSFLESLSKKLGVSSRVIFTGRVIEEEKVEYYNLADYFIYPSNKEGFGLSVVESMACGKVTLTSDIPPFKEIAVGNTNILALPLVVDIWAKEIISLTASPQRQKSIRDSARRFADKLSWQNIGSTYLLELERLLSRNL